MQKTISAKIAQNFVSANKLCDFNIILLLKERFSGRIPTTQVGKVAELLTIHKKYCTQRIAALVEQGYLDIIFSKKNPNNSWFKAVSNEELKKKGLIMGKLKISLEPYFINLPTKERGNWEEYDKKIKTGIADRKSFRSALHCSIHKAVLEKYIKPKKDKEKSVYSPKFDKHEEKPVLNDWGFPIPNLVKAKEIIAEAHTPFKTTVEDYAKAERKKRAARGYKRIASSTFISRIETVNTSKGFSSSTVRKHLLRGQELGLVEKTRRLKVLSCSAGYIRELKTTFTHYNIIVPEDLMVRPNAEVLKIFEYGDLSLIKLTDKQVREKARFAVKNGLSYKKALTEIDYMVKHNIQRDAKGSAPFIYVSQSGNVAILQELPPIMSFA